MEELLKSKRKALRLAQIDNTSHKIRVATTKAKSDKYERFCVEGISEKDTTDITDLLNQSLEKGEIPDD